MPHSDRQQNHNDWGREACKVWWEPNVAVLRTSMMEVRSARGEFSFLMSFLSLLNECLKLKVPWHHLDTWWGNCSDQQWIILHKLQKPRKFSTKCISVILHFLDLPALQELWLPLSPPPSTSSLSNLKRQSIYKDEFLSKSCRILSVDFMRKEATG